MPGMSACCGMNNVRLTLSEMVLPLNKQQAREDISQDKTFQENLRFLGKVTLFSRLPPAEMPRLVAAMTMKEFSPPGGQLPTAGAVVEEESGDVGGAAQPTPPPQNVVTEGEQGNEFFLIRSGEAAVLKGTTKIATLKAGDYFGESSLLEGCERNATVAASGTSKLVVLSLTRADFEKLELGKSLCLPRRHAVCGDPSGDVGPLEGGEDGEMGLATAAGRQYASAEEQQFVVDAILQNEYLKPLVTVDQVKQMAAKAYQIRNIMKGDVVIQENDLNANTFYIVAQGSFLCYKKHTGPTNGTKEQVSTFARVGTGNNNGVIRPNGGAQADGEMHVTAANKNMSSVDCITTFCKCHSFGERSLMYNEPRGATVEAVEDNCVLYGIDRRDFRAVLREQMRNKMRKYAAIINRVDLLKMLLKDEKELLAECLTELKFKKGMDVIREGTPGDALFILYKGEVVVKTLAQGRVKLLHASENDFPYFGEQALVKDENRNATITVESDSAEILSIDRDTFEQLLGPLKDIMRFEGNERRPSSVSRGVPRRMKHVQRALQKPEFKNLRLVGVLGAGGFGSVTLQRDATSRKSKHLYALKKISKGYIVQHKLQRQICSERLILSMTDSKFIVTFFGTYNIRDSLYFLMEACLGGELFALYNTKGFHGSVAHCKFYTACVIRAFEHLHERKIVYRDLKPENLLLDTYGWLKLADMGLAKFTLGRTYTTCGTPDYFAPEVVHAAGHTQAVDWWTLGILIYELMTGEPPFDGHPMVRYKKILAGLQVPGGKGYFPAASFRNTEVKDLILNLCALDPKDRLPMRPGGVEQNLYTHPFFEFSKWAQLEKGDLRPPYVPTVKNPLDQFSHLDPKLVRNPSIPYVDPKNGWDKDFA